MHRLHRIRRGGEIAPPPDPVKVARLDSHGLAAEVSTHSLRSGFVTEAGRAAVPLGEAMAMTGHRSTASLVGYFRQDGVATRAARLLDP